MNKVQAWTRRHPWVYVGVVVVVLVVVVPLGIRKASAQCAFNSPEGKCYSAAQLAHKYHNGTIRHAHGFNAKAEFAHPRATKRIFVRKIAVAFKHLSPAHKQRVIAAMNANSKAGNWCAWAACIAQREYNMAHRSAGCIAHDHFTVLPGLCVPNNHHPFTKAGIQRFGSVLFCGTLTVLAIAGAPETMGGTGYATIMVSGGACGMQAWIAIDPAN